MGTIQRTNSEIDEQKLFEEVKNGDKLAFSRLYDNYVNNLFNFGRSLTSDKDLVKDCIHDVFVKFYMRKDELHSIENCKAYIFISLKNKICDEMRRKAYMSDTAVEDFPLLSYDDVEKNYIEKENQRCMFNSVNFLMGQLSIRQREALTLYYIEGRKYEDICQIMSMNYQSVRNLMYRGLTKLRSIVK
jgi:RNA polymerase sigma factor (sigma-70 family)